MKKSSRSGSPNHLITNPRPIELTKEHFEQYLDQRLSQMVTAAELTRQLDAQSRDLKAHAEELQVELARMVNEGFEDIQSRLDVKARVGKREHDMRELRNALPLTT